MADFTYFYDVNLLLMLKNEIMKNEDLVTLEIRKKLSEIDDILRQNGSTLVAIELVVKTLPEEPIRTESCGYPLVNLN